MISLIHSANQSHLNYIGMTPDLKYFKNPNEIIIKSNWDIKEETLKYLKNDILILQNILIEFATYIGMKVNIDITKHLTIASLAYQVYFTLHYKNEFNLKIINKNLEKTIKESYYGGHTEVYKHYGKDLYDRDLRSRLPFAMLKDMPVGNPIYSTSKILNDYFGFVKVEITAKNVQRSCLPIRNDNGNLSYPTTGKWIGMYFSEELKSISKYGYEIRVLWGINFDRNSNLFTDYVNYFYKDKLEAKLENNSISSRAAQLMLNSLYGKFGMNEIKNKTIPTRRVFVDKLIKNHSFSEYEELNEENILLTYENKQNYRRKVNVAISSAKDQRS